MKKRLCSLALALVMCLSLFPATASAATPPYKFSCYFTQINDEEMFVTLAGINGSLQGEVTIPSSVGGFPLRRIAGRALADQPEMTSVVIPDSVTSIESQAFVNCTALEEVRLPAHLEALGEKVFENTPWFDNRPDGLVCEQGYLLGVHGTLPQGDVVVPKGVSLVSQSAFTGNQDLTSLTLPSSVKTINYGAFDGCRNLTAVNGLEYVRELSPFAFRNCVKLSSITLNDALTIIPRSAFENCESIKTLSLPRSLKELSPDSFRGCRGLTAVSLPDGITVIDDYAFVNCTSLTQISLPATLERVGNCPFAWTAWEKSMPDGPLYIDDVLVQFKGAVPQNYHFKVRPGTRIMADYLFEHNKENLTAVTIPGSVRHVGGMSFTGCKDLTTVVVEPGVKSLGGSAFANCPALTSVTLGEGLNELGYNVFGSCTALESIDLPQSLTNIGWHVFENCTALKAIVLPNHLREIGPGTFSGCSKLQTVALPTRLEKIWNLAFEKCPLLSALRMPASVKEIGEYAFRGDRGMQSITFAGDAPRISPYAFDETNLTIRYPGDNPTWAPEMYRASSDKNTQWSPVLPGGILNAPVNVTLSASRDDVISLQWDAVSGAKSYEVWRGSLLDQTFAKIGTTSSTTFTDREKRDDANTYLYHIQSVGSNGQKGAVSAVASYEQELKLAPITLSHMEDGRVLLRWAPVPGGSDYHACIGRPGNTEKDLKWVEQDENGYFSIDDFSPIGEVNTYYVSARKNSDLASSNIVRGARLLPRPHITVSKNTAQKPVITWQPIEGAVQYEVQCSNGGDFTTIATTDQTTLTHTDALGGDNTYRIRALWTEASGNSEWSPTATVSLPLAKLPAPQVSVALNSDDDPVLTWNEINGAEKYEVRAKENDGSFQTLKTVTGTKLTHTSANPGSTYTYQVRAIASNPKQNSDWSRSVSIAIPKPVEKLAAPIPSASLNQDGKPVVSWNASNRAARYEVRVSTNGQDFSLLDTVTGTKLTHTSAKAGTTYSYQVRAMASDPQANSDWSRSVSITVPKPVEPPKPTQLPAPDLHASADPDSGKPILTWNAVEGAVKYEVYLQSNFDGGFDLLYTAKGTRLRHGSAEPLSTNGYQIRAIAADGTKGQWSAVVYCSCFLARHDLTVSQRSDGKPVLTWDKIDGATGYVVYYSTNGGDFQKLSSPSGTRLNHTSAKPGNSYIYKVCAVAANGAASSAWSDEVSFTVKDQELTAPALTATNKRTTGKPYLKWTKVDGAEKYEVYRATSKDGKYTRLWDGSGTALTNGSAKAGTTYYYKVRAIAADGTKGPWSTIKTRTCDLAQPDVKVTFRSDGKPVLTWQKVSGAVKYEVYRRTDGGDFTRLTTVKGTKLTNSSAKSGHTYTYKVRAIAKKSAANSSYSYYDTVKVK